MRQSFTCLIILGILRGAGVTMAAPGTTNGQQLAHANLWDLGQSHASIHRFSTLFTAQDVRDRLSSEAGLVQALDWCKKTAVTKVYIEEFRDGYQPQREALIQARDRFRQARLVVSGCITPTQIGKASSGYKTVSCYTDAATQEKVQGIFEFAASLFDEIMIDDFWFTDCTCAECETARHARTVRVGAKTYPVSGDTWEDYRCELMARVSQERLLAASKKVNPKVQLIIKYPQWYDNFHMRGYEVLRETADFDTIWVGTESRDYADPRWGGTVQYESYFIMRWLGQMGGAKCGGGWYDWLGTTPLTYVEQARQTILGGAKESMLFCYGGLQSSTGPKNIEALRADIPELLNVAKEVRTREPIGLAAYKPANSHPEKEQRIFDSVGMLGLPLAPCHEFPTNAPTAFFSVHALKDTDLVPKLTRFIAAGKPVLLTDGLARRLEGKLDLNQLNVATLAVKDDPKSVLRMTEPQLNALREPFLRALKTRFQGPNQVGLYLFSDGSWVIENFTDAQVAAEVNGKPVTVTARGWIYQWKN